MHFGILVAGCDLICPYEVCCYPRMSLPVHAFVHSTADGGQARWVWHGVHFSCLSVYVISCVNVWFYVCVPTHPDPCCAVRLTPSSLIHYTMAGQNHENGNTYYLR